jgi:phospholipid/cholesterol/gamma-HCH transport system substrate-binding protein
MFRVAALVVVATAVLGTLVYLLVGGAMSVERVAVYLYAPDATGLAPRQPVRVDGVVVGKVDSIGISKSSDPRRAIRITLFVNREYLRDIPADSTAQISSETLIGDRFVDVASGISRQRLRAGGEIAYQPTADLMKSFDMTQFTDRLEAIGNLLTDLEQGRTRLGRFVKGDETYWGVRKRLADAEQSLIDARTVTTSVGKLLNTDELYRNWIDPIRRIDDALEQLQAGKGSAGEYLVSDARYIKMLDEGKDLRQSIAKLRASEFMASDAMYDNLNRRAAALIESVDQMNTKPMLSSEQAYETLNGAAAETGRTIQEFRTDPRKFLRLGLF